MARPRNNPVPRDFAEAVREARLTAMKRLDRGEVKHVDWKVLQDAVVADLNARIEEGAVQMPKIDAIICDELQRLDDRDAATADEIVEGLAYARDGLLGEQDPWLDRFARTEHPETSRPSRTRWRYVTEDDLRAMAARRRRGALDALQAAEEFTTQTEVTIKRMRQQGVIYVGDLEDDDG